MKRLTDLSWWICGGVIGLALLAGAGCGDDADDTQPPIPPPTTPPPTPTVNNPANHIGGDRLAQQKGLSHGPQQQHQATP